MRATGVSRVSIGPRSNSGGLANGYCSSPVNRASPLIAVVDDEVTRPVCAGYTPSVLVDDVCSGLRTLISLVLVALEMARSAREKRGHVARAPPG